MNIETLNKNSEVNEMKFSICDRVVFGKNWEKHENSITHGNKLETSPKAQLQLVTNINKNIKIMIKLIFVIFVQNG